MDKERKLIIELADNAACMRMFDSIKRKPGQTVLNLPAEQREVLQGLTSDHVDGIMPFWLRKKK